MVAGKLIRLRGLEKTDIDNIMSWINNEEITQYLLAFTVPLSRAMEEKWLERACFHSETDKMFAIETLDGEYIGGCGIHCIDSINRHAEIGLAIGKENFLSKGYGSDTIDVLLRIAFHRLNLNKIYLRVFSNNTRGIRCYTKCGFKEVGRMKQHRYSHGQFHDEVIMEIFHSEWEASKKLGH